MLNVCEWVEMVEKNEDSHSLPLLLRESSVSMKKNPARNKEIWVRRRNILSRIFNENDFLIFPGPFDSL